MSSESKIEWTNHTFNPWWGCTKVHAGCKNCYAEAQDKRWGGSHWGNNPRRMVLGEWGKPAKWDRDAQEAGRIDSVFCASMCDLFEDYDGPVVDQQGYRLWIESGWKTTTINQPDAVTLDWLRLRVFTLIHNSNNLRWLLLTKRPENITRMVPPEWLKAWPENVWTGTSPCDQETADVCIPNLVRVPGPHFLSCEPLVGPIDLHDAFYRARRGPEDTYKRRFTHSESGVHWVIAGGESGHHARPCDVAWLRSLRDQCRAAGVPFFCKQLGSRVICPNDHVSDWNDDVPSLCVEWPESSVTYQGDLVRVRLQNSKGGDISEWPEDLRVREFPW